MIKHTIYLTKLFSEDRRIAFHLASDLDKVCSTEDYKYISDNLDGLEYSIQSIIDDDYTIDSLVESDPFFKDITFYDNFEEFLKQIDKDSSLSSLDVGKYLLTRLQEDQITAYNTKLQKLVYLAYEDYLFTTRRRLFEDTIEAWQFGPVQRDLYVQIKKKQQDLNEDTNLKIDSTSSDQSLRILFSRHGIEKLKSIDKTYDKFKLYTSTDLVDYTHREGSAWYMTYNPMVKKEITDDKILESSRY